MITPDSKGKVLIWCAAPAWVPLLTVVLLLLLAVAVAVVWPWELCVRFVVWGRSLEFHQTKLFVGEVWGRRSANEKLVWSFTWLLLPVFVLADFVDDWGRSLME